MTTSASPLSPRRGLAADERPGAHSSMKGAGETRCLEIRALNHMHIAAAFGEVAVGAVRASMVEAVSRFLAGAVSGCADFQVEVSGPGGRRDEGSGVGLLWVELPEAVRDGSLSSVIEGLSRALALAPVVVGDDRIHLAPSVRLVRESAGDGDAASAAFDLVPADAPFGGEPVLACGEWRERYRRDMAVVARLFEDLSGDRLTLALQPIRMVGRASGLLYEECLLRIAGSSPAVRQIGLDILAAERLGLIRALDNYVVWSALDRMRADPELRLGVNVSAQSACCDGWWAGLEHTLGLERGLAERLTIEITETATLPSVAAATAFTIRMRSLGCRIALDDFGAGREAIRSLYALQPDIVKVDAFFVRQARNSAKGQAALRSLVGFSRAIGGAVVVEGVETRADSDAALQAGAVWQQGHFIEAPRLAFGDRGEGEARYEDRPVFGRRSSAPVRPFADAMSRAAFAGEEPLVAVQPDLALRRLPRVIPLAALLWALIAGALWRGWGGGS